jgi:hypothetical protein
MKVKTLNILPVLFCILLAQLAFADTEVTVTEGDLVNLSLASEDPDNDNLFTTFTAPVNNKGLWQTEIGDAGTYFVNASACDGELCDSTAVKINVLAKIFPPVITSYSPRDLNMSIKEGYSILFSAGVEDLDSSKLYISWKLDGKEVSTGLSYQYDTDLYSAGQRTVRFTVSDGDLQDQILWLIDVENVNAPPVIDEMKDITAVEGDLVKITPTATDIDNDKITYAISEPVGDDGEWQTGFDDAGDYNITITASDGSLTSSKTLNLKVENNDRIPVIAEYAPLEDKVYAKEGDEVFFSLRASDPDGDDLSYVWTVSGVEVGYKKAIKYTLDYDSAGVNVVECTVSDGTVKTSKKWVLIVENINQPPVLAIKDSYYFNEGDLVKITPNATDSDNDSISYSFSRPLDEKGEWQTDYRSSGVYAVNISAYDGEAASSSYTKIIIKNIDVPIIFGNISRFYADEGSNISIKLEAYNPGGESIIFSAENLPEAASIENDELKLDAGYDTVKRHTGMLGRTLKALKLYRLVFSDSKTFRIKVKAEAGSSSSAKDIKIVVLDKNRAPVIEAPSKIVAREGDLIKINYRCYDEDNDSLKVKLSKQFNKKGEWQTGFDDAGEYNISLEADDNLDRTSKIIRIVLENYNRKPVISIDDYIKVSAGKQIKLAPVIYDPDNDNITVTYSGWMDSESYLTTVNDTGMHTVTISADDGTDATSRNITIDVKEPGLFWFYAKYVLFGLLLLIIIITILLFIEKRRAKKKEEREKLNEEKERLGKERFEKVKKLMGIK